MKAWNVDASQTGNLLGLLTAKAQETGISVDTLESNVLDNNAAFKEMGLSLPQAINLMAQFDATVDAETLKEMTTVNDDVSELATGDNEQENAEDDENTSNEDKATNPPSEPETGENGANTEPQEAEDEPEDKVIIPQGKMKVTVICDGSLNIRRSAAWGNENICGRAIRGQSYYVKEIHVVDGKKIVRTIGDLYLSGESEHVQFEQL